MRLSELLELKNGSRLWHVYMLWRFRADKLWTVRRKKRHSSVTCLRGMKSPSWEGLNRWRHEMAFVFYMCTWRGGSHLRISKLLKLRNITRLRHVYIIWWVLAERVPNGGAKKSHTSVTSVPDMAGVNSDHENIDSLTRG